jgi:hypothetical protein
MLPIRTSEVDTDMLRTLLAEIGNAMGDKRLRS